jgi:hypothetical protein
MSYTLTPLRNNSSPSRSCRSVSIVFGCKPSALPVAVLSARSSNTIDLIPYRASVELHPTYQHHVNPEFRGTYLRKHQSRRSSSGDDHILHLRDIINGAVWNSVEAFVDCHRSHGDVSKCVMAIRWSGVESCFTKQHSQPGKRLLIHRARRRGPSCVLMDVGCCAW